MLGGSEDITAPPPDDDDDYVDVASYSGATPTTKKVAGTIDDYCAPTEIDSDSSLNTRMGVQEQHVLDTLIDGPETLIERDDDDIASVASSGSDRGEQQIRGAGTDLGMWQTADLGSLQAGLIEIESLRSH